MAPERSTSASKRRQSSLKQATLSFTATKRGAAVSLKAKAKAKAKAISRAKSETESEGEDDDDDIIVEASGYGGEEAPAVQKQTLDMQDKSGRYRNYFRAAKEMMGGLPPSESILSSCFINHLKIVVHAEGQTKIHQMLRVFDNTYDYGPCVGLTRLERWERAEALGLNPPIEV